MCCFVHLSQECPGVEGNGHDGTKEEGETVESSHKAIDFMDDDMDLYGNDPLFSSPHITSALNGRIHIESPGDESVGGSLSPSSSMDLTL